MIRKRSRRDSETAGNGARVTRCYFIVQATGWVSRAGGAAGPLPDHVARIGGSEEPTQGGAGGLEELQGGAHVAALDAGLEAGQPDVGPRRQAARPHRLDAVVLRGGDLLLGGHQLLVELLAGPEADEADRDVLVGLEAREADHLAREVEDADRLAHVEDEDLAATAER